MEMVEATLVERLNKVNPFVRWDLLMHKIRHVERTAYIRYMATIMRIPIHSMDFGDSIFIQMKKGFFRIINMYYANDNMHFIWYRKDPVYGVSGVRAFSLIKKPKYKRPSRSFKIYWDKEF